MTCAKPDTLWCNNALCRNNQTRDGAPTSKDRTVACPKGYSSVDYVSFKDGFSTRFLRVCKRLITPGTQTLLKCATNSNGTAECPNNMCNASTVDSVNYMNKYCDVDDRGFSDSHCIQWKIANVDAYNDFLNRKCGNVANMGKRECRDYCLANPGKCNAVPEFCVANPDDPLCSCINSSLNNLPGSAGAPAVCFDSKCQNTGYKTQTMYDISKNCPSYTEINCTQVLNSSGQGVIENSDLKQICSAQTSSEQNNVAPTGGAQTSSEAPSTTSESSVDGIFTTEIMLLMFVVFMFFIYMVIRYKNTKAKNI